MTKLFFLTLIISTSVYAQEMETILLKKFVATKFGIKSRTLDKKDAEAVLKEIHQFKISNPAAEISRIEILTCTSDYELPSAIVTYKKIDEHVQLAKERNEMIKNELVKGSTSLVSADSRICGPEFNARVDLNDRFVTKQSGEIFNLKFKALLDNQDFVTQLREEALVENPESLKQLYPSPFLAKFKPFQGIRLIVWGQLKQSRKSEKSKELPSGKNQ